MLRVLLLFLFAFGALALPVLGALWVGFFGSPPYLLREALPVGHSFERDSGAGVQVQGEVHAAAVDARQAAAALLAELPLQQQSRLLQRWRYVRADNGRHGLLLVVQNLLLHLQGPDRDALDRALAALPEVIANPDPNPVWRWATTRPLLSGGALFAYAAAFLLALAHLGSWAGSIEPTGQSRLALADLRQRLLAIDGLPAPLTVQALSDTRLQVDWRIADTRWVSAMELGGLQRAHRIVLDLDADAATVRVIDQSWAVDWSAGVGRLSAGASYFRGISFADFQRGNAYGLLLDDSGEWRFDEAYDYRFKLAEMKHPLIDAVLASGWRWKPVVSFSRWLGG